MQFYPVYVHLVLVSYNACSPFLIKMNYAMSGYFVNSIAYSSVFFLLLMMLSSCILHS